MPYLDAFKTILEFKRYSKSTIVSYLNFLKIFIRFLNIGTSDFKKLNDKDILVTVIEIVKTKHYGISSQKQLIGAINLFYNELFKRSWTIPDSLVKDKPFLKIGSKQFG